MRVAIPCWCPSMKWWSVVQYGNTQKEMPRLNRTLRVVLWIGIGDETEHQDKYLGQSDEGIDGHSISLTGNAA